MRKSVHLVGLSRMCIMMHGSGNVTYHVTEKFIKKYQIRNKKNQQQNCMKVTLERTKGKQ